MAKKKEDGFETPRPPPAKDAGPADVRYREATPSGVQFSVNAARPLAAPRRSGVAESEASFQSGITKAETLAKQEIAATAKRGSRKSAPERPELSASDVEWWAESALNSTFERVGPAGGSGAEPSQVVPIEDAIDPNEGDRITPVFLESITPVFPESKVREVMALADEVEKAKARAAVVVPPVAPPPPAPPEPPAVTMHAVKFAVQEGAVWDVPVLDAPPPPSVRPVSRPVAPPLPPPSASSAAAAASVLSTPLVAPPAPVPVKASAPLAPLPSPRLLPRSLPGVFEEDDASDDQLHAVSLASAGAHVSMAIWVAIGLILIMVAATMATVG